MNNAINNRILIIDDNRAIHEDFRKILCPRADDMDRVEAEFFGDAVTDEKSPVFEVDSAYQGDEGVAKLCESLDEGRPYAVAFVDVRMPPGMDGIETISCLRALCPDIQIVICTAYSDYSWQEIVSRIGRSDQILVLKKPFAAVEAQQLACALTEKWTLNRQVRGKLEETESIVADRTRELRESNEQLRLEIERRKKMETQLLRAQRLESIGTLASGISHDLNNVISPILMSAPLLRSDLSADAKEEIIATIETSAERAAGIVKQVLTFARGTDGAHVLVQPRYVLREVIQIASETFPRDIRVDCGPTQDLSCVLGDTTQMQQVLMNLCVNARDAMPEGGVLSIDADDIDIDAEYASMTPGARVGRYVRVRVTDTGTGIPEDVIDKIFDPFFTTKPAGKGTGLGLSTAIGIIKGHGGFITVQSTPGKGTTFELFFPASVDAAENREVPEEAAPAAGRGQLILVVDDEREIRKATETVLAAHGYRAVTACDGAEALSIFALRSDEISAVLTDVMMPIVDGVSLTRAMRKIDPGVKVIAATGCNEDPRTAELRSLQVTSLLKKPFNSNVLLHALDRTLSSSSSAATTPA
jgi:two-component system, NtrC family, sensor kinase